MYWIHIILWIYYRVFLLTNLLFKQLLKEPRHHFLDLLSPFRYRPRMCFLQILVYKTIALLLLLMYTPKSHLEKRWNGSFAYFWKKKNPINLFSVRTWRISSLSKISISKCLRKCCCYNNSNLVCVLFTLGLCFWTVQFH